MKKKRQLHHWTKEDFILTLFITKYGTSGLYMRDKESISKKIGTSVGSLTKMVSNLNHLLGKPNQLNHIKNLQQEVFNEYNNKPYLEYLNEVRSIVHNDEMSRQMIMERMGIKNYRFIGRREKELS